MNSSRVDQLERTMLDLGTEIYRLKAQISDFSNFQDKFIRIMKGLKLLLDEKGLITKEDFEAAVELGEAINQGNMRLILALNWIPQALKNIQPIKNAVKYFKTELSSILATC